jgi:hypothetical protein
MYNISIICVYDNIDLNHIPLLYSILNQDYIHYLNIELVIIDNGTDSFFNKWNNNKLLQEMFLEKNINIKIINLFEKQIKSIALNIGIQNSLHKIVTFCNFNNIIFGYKLIYQCILNDNNDDDKIIYNKYNINENYHQYFNSKNNILDILHETITTNSNNVLFNKNNIKYMFPVNSLLNTDEKNTIIFLITNYINNVLIEFNNTPIEMNDIMIDENNKNNYYKLIEKMISDNIDYRIIPENIINHNLDNLLFQKISKSIIKNFYSDEIEYIDLISDIYNI